MAAFFYDLITAPADGQDHDAVHYPGSYLTSIITACEVYTSDQGSEGWYRANGADELTYCFEERSAHPATCPTRGASWRRPSSPGTGARLDAFREAAMNAHWRHGDDLEDDAVVRRIAAAVGMDARDPDYLARVDAVRRESINAGVTGIPTFFIGDAVVVGCQPYETLAAAVERAGGTRRRDDGASPASP